MNCLEKITAAQKGLEHTDAWMVGEQLKGICKDPACAELVAADMDNPQMGLKDCAAKIKAWADEKRKETKAQCVCVPPDVAEEIIREFYGLPGAKTQEAPEEDAEDLLAGLWDEVF